MSDNNNNNNNAATTTSTESDDIRARKQALRKEIRAKVRAVSDDALAAQSEQVWQRLFALPEYQAARTVGLFLSMPKHEIKTATALRHCAENDKVIYVPQVGKNFEHADMELIRVFATNDDDDDNNKEIGRAHV